MKHYFRLKQSGLQFVAKVQETFRRHLNFHKQQVKSNVYAFVHEAGGLRFESRAGQIVNNGANCLPQLCQFKGAMLLIGATMRRWARPTRRFLRRNAASIMKGLI